jgi:hypothetical protein
MGNSRKNSALIKLEMDQHTIMTGHREVRKSRRMGVDVERAV